MSYPYGNYQLGYPQTHPYVHHQRHGGHPSYGFPSFYGQYSAPSYNSNYSSSPNVFSIIKTDKGDDVYALNNYDTLTLESSDSSNLIITGDKTNKKVTFDLSGVVINESGSAATSGTATLDGASSASILVPSSAVTATSRVLLTRQTLGTGTPGHLSVDPADNAVGISFKISSNGVSDNGKVTWLLLA